MRHQRVLFSLLLFLLAIPLARSAEVKLFITGDVHGYVENDPKRGRIGYPLLQGRINECVNQGYTTYLLDAGDAFTGNSVAHFDSGRSIAALMGKIGYHVLAPGNHAFDYNQSEKDPLYYSNTLLRLVRENEPAGHPPLAVTSLNLTRDGAPLPGVTAGPVVLHEADGLRIIVVGVLIPYIDTRRPGRTGYDFGLVEANGQADHAATREKILEQLRQALAEYNRFGDVVVVLSHVGHADTPEYADGQLSGRDIAGVPNVDFVADAHSHTRTPPEWLHGVFYANAGRYLEGFTEITVGFDGNALAKRLELKTAKDLTDTFPDPQVTRLVAEMKDGMGLGDRLFTITDPELFTDNDINMESKALGRLLCRAMVEVTQTDLAIHNSGGIRSGLSAGPVTVGDLYNVVPFQNDLVSFTMTGRQLTEFFDKLPQRNTNGFPQFYGMTVYAWPEGENGLTLRSAGVLDREGTPLQPDKTYSVAVNSYIAGGGDGYDFSSYTSEDDFGDSNSILVRAFRAGGGEATRLDELRDNRTLLLYPNEETARKAWQEAVESAANAAVPKAG